MADGVPVQLRVNGAEVTATVTPTTTLAAVLRGAGLKSVRLGCGEGVCGSCSVLVDGRSLRACLTLAAQMAGVALETVEGFARDPQRRAIQEAFVTHFAAQCGFCTGGMLAVVAEYLADVRVQDHADETLIRERLNTVVCRCTGYQQIVDAVKHLAARRLGGSHEY